jgi:hypothetical protein
MHQSSSAARKNVLVALGFTSFALAMACIPYWVRVNAPKNLMEEEGALTGPQIQRGKYSLVVRGVKSLPPILPLLCSLLPR